MSRTELSKLVGEEVSSRKKWERAKKHLADETKKSKFYKSKVKQADFPYTQNQLIQVFLDKKLITLITTHDENLELMEIEDFENQDLTKNKYGLNKNKKNAIIDVSNHLGYSVHTIRHHFPKNIRIVHKSCKSCIECKRRDYLIDFLNKYFELNFNKDFVDHDYISEERIKFIRITRNGVRRYLNKKEQKIFKDMQEVLMILDHHFSCKTNCNDFFHDLITEQKLKQNTVVLQIDHLKKIYYGLGNENLKGGDKTNSDGEITPLGLVFNYRDQEGIMKRISRLIIPDKTVESGWQVKNCVMKLLSDETDIVLQQVLTEKNHMIVIKII